MKKIGIVFKKEDRIIANTAGKLADDLSSRYKVVLNEKDFHGLEFIITLGGDGTILRASKISSKLNVPLLAVHLGGLGIMSEILLEGISDAIARIRGKKYQIDSRMMLEVEVDRGGRKRKNLKGLALNDLVIGKNEIARTIKLDALIGGRLIASYVGDGVIVSTPSGSTAYNFAVMGPILPPNSRSFIISPICPHRGANRSIVLGEPLKIKLIKGKNILLTIDGQNRIFLQEGDLVSVFPSKLATKFIRFKEYDLWKLLRDGMGWG